MEMAILREMLERKEITEISWVPTDTQIAHSKKGVPSFKILGFISELKESSVCTIATINAMCEIDI